MNRFAWSVIALSALQYIKLKNISALYDTLCIFASYAYVVPEYTCKQNKKSKIEMI